LDNGAKAQEIFKDIVTHYADFHIARQAQIQLDLEDILQ
jgi:hypothetical protein